MNLKERSKNSSVIKVAGGLQFKGDAPTSDDVIPETGIYFNTNNENEYYPYIWGVLIVIKVLNITHEVFISSFVHKIWTRRHNNTEWNEWGLV